MDWLFVNMYVTGHRQLRWRGRMNAMRRQNVLSHMWNGTELNIVLSWLQYYLKINLERSSNRLSSMNRHINILLHSTTADTNSSNEVAIVIVDRLAAGEDHQTVIRCLQAPKVVAGTRLSAVVQAVRRELAVEQDDGLSLLLRHVDAAVVGVVHVDESDEVGGGIEDSDVLENTEKLSAHSHLQA